MPSRYASLLLVACAGILPLAAMCQPASQTSLTRPLSVSSIGDANGAASSQPERPALTREEAEQIALQRNPRTSISHLLALAQHQVYREYRSAALPTFTGSVSGQEANEASRVSSGSLTASRLFTRVGAGVNFSQLITDFGRTSNLVAFAKLRERAQQANELATREDVVLVTDQLFYSALQAQAVLDVARQSVNLRKITQGQVNELTRNNLRSTLDLTFANVNVSQAELLQLDAQNNAEAAIAALAEILGAEHLTRYKLVDTTTSDAPPPPDEQALIAIALKQRPDLQSLDLEQQARERYRRAEAEQRLPSLAAAGTVGVSPVRPGRYYVSSWDGAIGANLNIPIFNGFLYSAEAKEAQLRAQAAAEQSRQLRDRIVRDVQTAWLDANNAFVRIGVTAQLLDQANQSLSLAQTRYKLGLSSIVELSQAQLQQTEAEISSTNARYQYRLTLAAVHYQTGVQP